MKYLRKISIIIGAAIKSQIEKKILKELLIRSIISFKRGVPFDCTSKSFKIKRFLNKLPIKLFPVCYGSCLHLAWNEPLIALVLQNSNIKDEKKLKKQSSSTGVFSYLMDFIEFSSIPISNLETHEWLHISVKRGCLKFKMSPTNAESRPLFRVQINKGQKYIYLQFDLKIMKRERILFKNSKETISKNTIEIEKIKGIEEIELKEMMVGVNLATRQMFSSNLLPNLEKKREESIEKN